MKSANNCSLLFILLLFADYAVFAQAPALIEKITVNKNRIDIKINPAFKKKYLTDDFFAEYDASINLSKLDRSILVMPFIMNVITTVWISGQNYSIESLDEELYHSLIYLKKIFQYMYPKTAWDGALIPDKLIKNSFTPHRDPNYEALLFSGGVDSTSSTLAQSEKKLLLITAWGQWDLPLNDHKLWKTITNRLRTFAQKYGHENSFFKSNYAEFLNYEVLDNLSSEISDWRIDAIEDLGWAGLTAPILIGKACTRLHIASSATWSYRYPLATNPIIDATIKFAGITITQDQFDFSRLDKIEYIANFYKHTREKLFLTVCQGQRDTNCCDCSKCLATIMELIAAGEDPRHWGFNISPKKALKRILNFSEQAEVDYAFIERMREIQETLKNKKRDKKTDLLNKFLSLSFEKQLNQTHQMQKQAKLNWEVMESLAPHYSKNHVSGQKKVSNYFVDKWQFAQLCDFLYDPESDPAMFPVHTQSGGVTFNPKDVQPGATIFLRARHTHEFFEKLVPSIEHPFIIIAHGEYKDGFRDSYSKYLHDKKVIAWFGTHPADPIHNKFHAIPLGVWANHKESGSAKELDILFTKLQKKKKNKLIYGNFSLWTHPERLELAEWIKKNKVGKISEPHLDFIEYLNEMAEYQFVLSPRGLGIDCYRTWEALLVGAIPVVKHSHLDELYKDLPVLIIDDWNVLTQEFLMEKYNEMKQKNYDLRSLYFAYWHNKIMNIRNRYLEDHSLIAINQDEADQSTLSAFTLWITQFFWSKS